MNQTDTIHLDIPASYKYLNVVSDCVSAMLRRASKQMEEATIYNVQLAVQEVCTNIVDHAYDGISDGRIKFTARVTSQPISFVIDVYDSGEKSFNLDEFQTDEIEEPDIDNLMLRGRGLFLIHQLMDTVEYTPQVGNNHWHIVKHLETHSA